MNTRLPFSAAAATLVLIGCAPASQSPGGAALPPPPATQSTAANPLPNDVRWIRNSAEYRGLVTQAYRVAAERLPQLSAGLAPGSWAVILDADETVIDNSEFQRRLYSTGTRYTEELWARWVREIAAMPVPGALEFTRRVQSSGGKIVIVTNRADSLCAPTRENLVKVGIEPDLVLCKPLNESDKNPRFQRVQAGTAAPNVPPLRVVAWVGDNILDFPGLSQEARRNAAMLGDFGVRFFLMPNPMYGSWTSNP